MTTSGTVLATSIAQHWHNFWRGEIGDWILNRGLRIVMLLIAAVLAARFVTWLANRVTRRLDLGFTESDALVRSEATKHRQAVASVISWVSIVLIYVVVVYEVIDVLPVPVGALVGPAAVLGAALGSVPNAWCRTYSPGSSSSWRSSTGSAIWSNSAWWGHRRTRPARWRTSRCG